MKRKRIIRDTIKSELVISVVKVDDTFQQAYAVGKNRAVKERGANTFFINNPRGYDAHRTVGRDTLC